MRVVVEVGGDQRFVIGGKDALQRAVGGFGDRLLDLFDAGRALGDELEVHDRDVGGRHADGCPVQLALQVRQNLADSLGGAGRGRDHVQSGGTGAVQVLVHRIDDALV